MKAAFLDRDGVINIDHDFVHRPDQWDWVPGAKEALARLKKLGYMIVVVTNQSGIGRGYYTVEQVDFLHEWANSIVENVIDAFYYCPHVAGDRCDCRKPRPGMLLRAISYHGIDPGASFMIGDKTRDIDAAESAGVRGYLFHEGNLNEFLDRVLDAEKA